MHVNQLGELQLLSSNVSVASTFAGRAKGLLGKTSIESDHVLCIPYTNLVHTVGMRFPIDCIFTDNKQRIIKILENVAPFRFAGVFCLLSHVYETKSGNSRNWNLQIGDRMYVDN
jgi:hypothetical protein